MSSYTLLSPIPVFPSFAVANMEKETHMALLAYFIDDKYRLARVSLVTRNDCSIINHIINEQIQISDEDHTDNEMLDAIEEVMSDRFMFRKEIPAIWIRNEDIYMKGFNSKLWADVFRRKTSGSWRRI